MQKEYLLWQTKRHACELVSRQRREKLTVLCRGRAPAQECQKGSSSVPADNYSLCVTNGTQDGICFENKNVLPRTKLPYTANLHSDGSRS